MIDTIDYDKLTIDQVSRLLGISREMVNTYTKDLKNPIPFTPIPDKKIGKTFKWSDVFVWWIGKKTKQADRISTFTPKDAIEAAKLEGQNLSNELSQIEIDLKKGNLLEATDVSATWSSALVDIKQALRNVGHIAATDIIDGMTYNKKKSVIDALIFQNLTSVIDKVDAAEVEPEHEEG